MKTLRRDPLIVLIEEKGFKRDDYEFYFTTVEGEQFPILYKGREVDEYSGYIVTVNLEHYFFWMDWDKEKEVLYLSKWKKVTPEKLNNDSPEEYLEALQKVIRRKLRRQL